MTILAIILAMACFVLAVLHIDSRRQLRGRILDVEKQKHAIDQLKNAVDQLKAQNATLAPYQKIIDIERAIRERKEEYLRSEKEALERAQAYITHARSAMEAEEAVQKEGLKEARRQMRERQENAESQLRALMEAAQRESDRIVHAANQKAEEIAGDAITAMREARELESVARAMKNIISGYGDEYLVPNVSVLDDLAEHFSHKDAGVQLKTARSRTRELVKLGRAGICSYAAPKRNPSPLANPKSKRYHLHQ